MAHLEHIGIAVHDAATVTQVYNDLFGLTPYKAETVTSEYVRTHFIQVGQTKLELLEALDPASAIATFIDKRGPGLHHLAFEVEDLEAQIARLTALGYKPLQASPKAGADSKQIVFLHPKQTQRVLIELCERIDAPLPTTTISADNVTLSTYAFGRRNRPAIVALPVAESSVQATLAPLLNQLEKHFFCVAFDAPPSGTNMDDCIRTVLSHYELENVHLFAFSSGAADALAYAQSHPEHVGQLVLHAPAVPSNDAVQPQQETLITGFDQDPHVAVTDVLALHNVLPHSRLAILPGAVHALHGLDVHSYERIVHNFLATA